MSYLDRRTPEEQASISERVMEDRQARIDADPVLRAEQAEKNRDAAERLARVRQELAWRANNPEEAAAKDAAAARARDEEYEQRQNEDEVWAQGERSEFADY